MSESFLTDLRALIDVDSSTGTRARYSSDAGLTRIPPLAVAFPRTPEQAIAAFDLARAHGVPLTARGGGTSCASNAIGPGLVLDFSRHMNRVISIDPEARTATVEPGCVGSTLQAAAAKHGLRFGPDPSYALHTRSARDHSRSTASPIPTRPSAQREVPPRAARA